ncbi:hypothetical protein [Actinoplanes subglobosus]|uniref:ASCH domain-containing protein n=1 Tax=Actinoplanes subglobosus TaxID=1547892 RepID=A0ABV8IRZ3_9ACTN
MSELRALTIRQPWAWATAHGGKTVENRTRPLAYRGRLAIHAGAAWSVQGGADRAVQQAFAPYRPAAAAGRDVERAHDPARFVAGAIVAVAELVDVHLGAGCCRPWGHVRDLVTAAPVHHLLLDRIRPLAVPVTSPGRQGLWRPVPAVTAQVLALLGEED